MKRQEGQNKITKEKENENKNENKLRKRQAERRRLIHSDKGKQDMPKYKAEKAMLYPSLIQRH